MLTYSNLMQILNEHSPWGLSIELLSYFPSHFFTHPLPPSRNGGKSFLSFLKRKMKLESFFIPSFDWSIVDRRQVGSKSRYRIEI
jgi:hypothetical protein